MTESDIWQRVLDAAGNATKLYQDPGPGVTIEELQASALKPLSYAFDTPVAQKYRSASLDTFNTDADPEYRKIKRLAERYIDKWCDLRDKPSGMYFYSSNAGSGKTFLACIIANELYSRYKVTSQIFTMAYLFAKIQESYDNPSVSELGLFNVMQHIPLLIIDEIGYEAQKTDWKHDKVLELIDTRYNAGKPTIFTSNLDTDALPYHARVISRIDEMAVLKIKFPDIDFRHGVSQSRRNEILSILKAESNE